MPRAIDLTGRVFGRLTVVSLAEHEGNRRRWACWCSCGAPVVTRAYSLSSGHARSCGCLSREKAGQRQRTHGATASGRATPEYSVWCAMNQRCSAPSHGSFRRYGGRGITVCERWRDDFAAFLLDMGPRPSLRHSIDRINNDGHYEPGNCRWATTTEQNRHTSRSAFVTAFGETLCMSEWAERFGACDETLRVRLKRGIIPERAIAEPLRARGESLASYRARLAG